MAFGFLTVLPVNPRSMASDEALGSVRAYFPFVGLTLGSGLVLLDVSLQTVFPAGLVNALLIAALVGMTRAIHVEGFMDACDALLGGFTRERRLEIMRDPHVGAFAVIGGMLLLLLKWTALGALAGPFRLSALILFPSIGRWAILMVMGTFPYARSEGMGAAFQRGRRSWHVALGLSTIAAASILLAGPLGVILLVVGSAVAWAAGWWMARLLGGLTGDTYGATNEVVELAVLLVVIVTATIVPSLFSPVWEWGLV